MTLFSKIKQDNVKGKKILIDKVTKETGFLQHVQCHLTLAAVAKRNV